MWNSLWINVLCYSAMALIGGTSGHILAWERLSETAPHTAWTLHQHIVRLFSTYVKSALLVLSVCFGLQIWAGWPPPLCFVIAGFSSVFSSETIRLVWDKGRRWFDVATKGP